MCEDTAKVKEWAVGEKHCRLGKQVPGYRRRVAQVSEGWQGGQRKEGDGDRPGLMGISKDFCFYLLLGQERRLSRE